MTGNSPTVELVVDDGGGITFPPQVLIAVNWEVGDSLEFRVGDNEIHVRKVPDTKRPPGTDNHRSAV